MAAMLDSKAVFAERAKEIGMNDEELNIMQAKNWGTFGNLAFACSYKPGQENELPLLKLAATITKSGMEDPPEERMPIIRRLFFEAYILASADMRARLEAREDDAPRKLALPERNQRSKDQKARLKGIPFQGQTEISHALVDMVTRLHEQNELEYIKWEQCTTRDQEMMGIKSDPVWKPDSQGVVREHRVNKELSADYSTDLLLKYVLQRRALAFDSNLLSSFENWETWHDVMLDAFMATPPEGYKRVTIEQLQRADLQMFKVLMRRTKDGIRPTLDGKYPLDQALSVAVDLPEVRLHLQPLQGDEKRGSKRPAADMDIEKLKAQVENQKNHIQNLMKKREGEKGGRERPASAKKDKGKGKGKNSSDFRMPRPLIGCSHMTDEDEPICFNFNLDGCTNARAGEKCPKGKHVCCKPNCYKPHPFRKNHD